MKYRLYESSGFVATCPAFAESDDFDALRLGSVPGCGVSSGGVSALM